MTPPIERRAASENPLRATTINDFGKLGTALGGRPTIVERLPSPTLPDVQDTIKNIEETRAAGCPFNGYRSYVSFMTFVGPTAGALSAPPREGSPSARRP